MSQEKAQLIAPLGNITFSGVTATGVITATTVSYTHLTLPTIA